ncbi:NIL domain-containing protein [Sphaerospermopsis kisseleviana CS-549]|uniref:NIL domain-containing protein n=1 Tax=Sphaerospermopsis kisseleviana CS-549 TaxID=3021783 RepID=A0ABT4ZKG6_9CYAN|nr:NIL domain-containing protein [Sphaerospermopsis kisseleviana]MDB9439877.1 NIL domain-containing protein [Sphaerospermopsis kisseleviana CS-549]BAZ79885.1 NIL domain-containing protein [Sphaerospermopsis kisseleviana NIES-73]
MSDENILISQRIRVRITKDYHQEPVISRLVSDYGLTINIKAAFLGQDAISDGWFDLDLQGTESQIANGLNYLQELKLELWDEDRIGNW